MALLPIWKDKDYDLGSASECYFQVRDAANNVLYTGKAVKAPGASTIKVRVNDIIADHLKSATPDIVNWHQTSMPDVCKAFSVYKSSNGTSWTLVSTDTFVFDWSYAARVLTSEADTFMQDPIIYRAAFWQPLFIELLDGDVVSRKKYLNGELVATDNATLADKTLLTYSPLQGCDKVTMKADNNARTMQWDVYHNTYCPHIYALCYLNALGGWDSLLLEGACSRKASVSRNTYNKAYDNSVRANANKANYLNERTDQWILRTGFLTDEESARMHHVLNSTQVFLYEYTGPLDTDGIVTPVRITDNAYEVKTYKGQGGKLYQYTINAEVLHNYIRR